MARVYVPELGYVTFPAEMPPEAIAATSNRLYRENLLRQQGEIKAAPSPLVGFAQSVLQRSGLPASREGVEAFADQPFWKRALAPLGVINLPFSAIGEAAQRGAEALGARPAWLPSQTPGLDFIVSPGSIAETATSFGASSLMRDLAQTPELITQIGKSMIPPVGAVQGAAKMLPASPIVNAAKRAYQEPPQMVQSAPVEPPVPPGAPGQGQPLLQPDVVPSQLEAAAARAGQRGPGLLSATEQPLITGAPARIARGTSEIVDELGRPFPTRPPQHIEPADALLPPSTPSGPLKTAGEVGMERRGVPQGPMRPTRTPLTEQQMQERADILSQSGFAATELAKRLGGAAVGGTGGSLAGAQYGETPEEKVMYGVAGGIAGAALGAAAPGLLSRWNDRLGKQIAFAERADMDVRTPAALLARKEAPKVGQRLANTPLAPPEISRTVSAIDTTLMQFGAQPTPDVRPLTLRLSRELSKNPGIVPALNAHLKANGGSLMDAAQLMVDSSRNANDLIKRAAGLSRVLEHEALSNPQAAKILDAIIRERPQASYWDEAGHFLRRSDATWRGLLVSAMRTAMRNLGLQQARVIGVEALEHTIEGSLMKLTGAGPQSEQGLNAASRYAWEYLLGWASPAARRETMKTLDAFPAFKDKLLQIYTLDVARQGTGVLGPGLTRVSGGALQPMGPVATQIDRIFNYADKGVRGVNALNRFQEVMTRKAAFRASLLNLLEQRGIKDLNAIPIDQLPPEDLARAVTHALRMTFAEAPSSQAPHIIENLFAKALDVTGKSGAAAVGVHAGLGVPFLRYIFNAGRFIAEHPYTSVAPALRTVFRLMDPAERALMTRGDFKPISKTMTGAAALLAGWQFVNSDLAGDGLLEAKTPFGNFNLAVLGPLIPAYVLPARFLQAWKNGTLVDRWDEFVRAATEMPRRVENLSLGVSNFLEAIPEMGAEMANIISTPDEESLYFGMGEPRSTLSRVTHTGQRMVGETLAGTLQFVTSLQRLFAAYGKYIPQLEALANEEDTKRDVSSSPLIGPTQARIPAVLGKLGIPNMSDLPVQTSALRNEPIPVENPLSIPNPMGVGPARIPLPADVIGFQGAPQRNPAEVAALTLGMKPIELAGQSTGFPGADRVVRGATGEIAAPLMSQFVESEKFAGLDKEMQQLLFQRFMQEIRGGARNVVRARIAQKLQGGEGLSDEEREYFDSMIKAQFDPRLREWLKSRGVETPR